MKPSPKLYETRFLCFIYGVVYSASHLLSKLAGFHRLIRYGFSILCLCASLSIFFFPFSCSVHTQGLFLLGQRCINLIELWRLILFCVCARSTNKLKLWMQLILRIIALSVWMLSWIYYDNFEFFLFSQYAELFGHYLLL